jgi:hypothetical protein
MAIRTLRLRVIAVNPAALAAAAIGPSAADQDEYRRARPVHPHRPWAVPRDGQAEAALWQRLDASGEGSR